MRKTRICPPVGAKMCGVTRVLMIGPLLLWAMCRTMRPHLAQGLRLRRPARPRAAMVVQTRRPAPREKARPRIPTPKPSGLEWAASSTKCQNPTPTQPLPLHASAFLSRFRGHLIPPTVEYSHRTTPQLTQPALMIRLPGPAQVLVLSGKGGVGKSTVASQLAMALSGDGADTGSAPRHAPYTPSSLARVLPEARRRRAEPPPVGRLLDIDICGPSAPRMLGAEAEEVRQAGTGWQPVWVADRLCVMSIGFMLPSRRDAVVWRGARKHALVRQFLRDVESPPPPPSVPPTHPPTVPRTRRPFAGRVGRARVPGRRRAAGNFRRAHHARAGAARRRRGRGGRRHDAAGGGAARRAQGAELLRQGGHSRAGPC